jgi:hypothetical protein
MQGIADGKTYVEIDDRGAAQADVDARESGASKAKIAYLQAAADQLKAQRDSLFRGETLRGLLLSSYACRPSDASRYRRLGRLRRRRRHGRPGYRRAGASAPH